MDGLRGFAVTLVFFVHYVTCFEPWLTPGSTTATIAESLRDLGHVGVDLFFALSGCLIWGMLLRSRVAVGTYLVRRVQRIYPAFLCVFLMYVGLALVMPGLGKLPESPGAAAIYLVQNLLLLPGVFAIPPFVTVAWSLSYEFCFYLVAPLIVAALAMRSWPAAFRVAAIGLCAVGMILLWQDHGPIRFAMFMPGLLLAETLRAQRGPTSDRFGYGVIALLLGLVVVIASRSLHFGLAARFALLGLILYITLLFASRAAGATVRVFAFTPLRWLGNMSYSYYLIHGVALKGIFLFLGLLHVPLRDRPELFWIFLLPMFALTLVPAATLFAFVERPYSLDVRRKTP